jgi:hypothetical protein
MARIDYRQPNLISAKASTRLGGIPLGYRQPPSQNFRPINNFRQATPFDRFAVWMRKTIKRQTLREPKLPCPNCRRQTKSGELSNHGGVCKFCQESFRAAHSHRLLGKFSHPSDLTSHKVQPHEANFDHGELCGITDFDWDAVEQQLHEVKREPMDVRQQAAAVITRIFTWVWAGRKLRTALVKFTALSAGLRADLVERDYRQIGDEVGVTKQSISRAAINAERAFGIHFSRSRSLESRKIMSRAAMGHPGWNKKAGSRRRHGRRKDSYRPKSRASKFVNSRVSL